LLRQTVTAVSVAAIGEMEFRILGPLEVLSGGKALDLGGQKQRALLAVLLLHANEVVSSERLIDALWEGEPPETALKALHVYVSHLRKLLGKERLETKTPGYLLRTEPNELDLARFRRLWDEGKLREALSVWRGPPLGDLAYEGFAQPAIARLEEVRLACLEERIDEDLTAGKHAELVGELEGLVKEHPLKERLRAQLMLSLYRSGRQAEALDAYQQARTTLVEQLGIEPGRQLRELHEAILRQDAALDVTPEEPERKERPAPRRPDASEPAPREVRKTITAVHVSLAVSSAGGAVLDPEALRRVSGRAFGEVEAAVKRHGGTVEPPAADSITAVFGLPVMHEDDALRAVRATVEIREALTKMVEELRSTARLEFRIGMSTGKVITGGAAGSQPRATGEPMTLAARFGQAAEPGDILIQDATRRLLSDSVITEPANGGWRLLRADSDAGLVRRFRSPMVGRARERRRLHDAFEQAVGDGSCQLFTVLGLAGVGKSRLVDEFLGDLAETALVTRGRCLPYGEGITYWPVMEAIKGAVGLDDVDSPQQAQAKLEAAFGDEQGAQLAARRVAEVVGLTEATLSVEEGFMVVRTLFETVARSHPLVVVFDDIHWGEPTFLDFVEHLADWTRDVPILLVCLARPELLDLRRDWAGGKLNATSILLEPLSEAESIELVENLAGTDLAESARRRIVRAAEGNPLFVEEMLALALEDDQPIGELVVPPTIQALLAARLDRLGDEERAVIERAAVEGKIFYEEAVTELLPEAMRATVQSALGSLLHKELIRPDRPSFSARTYRFRHLLIRDAAYESIPKEARAEMHESFGRWLDQAAGERATEYEEIVGYHLERAYWYRIELGPPDDTTRALAREAAERLGEAGRRAFVRSDAPAAVNLVSRAASLLPADDPLRVELVPNVRAMQGMAGDVSWADRVLTEAVEAAATTGDRRLASHALVQRGFLRLFTESGITPNELFDVAERAIAVFEDLGDELGLARAWRLVAQAHYLDRRAGESVEASERALLHVRRAGDRFEETEIVTWLSVALGLGPTPASRAVQRCKQLLAETAGDPVLEATLLGVLGCLEAMQNRLSEARQFFDEGRHIMDELGEVIWIYWLWALLADPVSGERELRWATELLERIGEKSHYSSTAAVLARATYSQGRYDEAEELSRAAAAASRPNDVHGQIAWRSTQAKLLAHRGELDAAEELAREALAFAEESDFLNTHADALMDFAEFLRLAGRPDDAAQTVEEAIDLYERKGNVVSAGLARSQLRAGA
jgi:DNA-binding SARP family transcriptional activator/tetratricopeptide (TPR) repeat protein